MNCEEFEELSGAFALGALPEDELRAAREHLASCGKSHAEAREMQAIAAGLANAAPEMEPPPALKTRLMNAIRSEAEQPPEPSAPSYGQAVPGLTDRVRGWFRTGMAGYALAAALAAVVVALLVWNVSLQDDDGRGPRVVDLRGANGQLIVIPERDIVVMEVEGLEAAPSGHVYQAWAVAGGQATSLGIVEVAPDGAVRQVIALDETGVEQIAVTIERAPGVDQPTADAVISVDL